VVDAQIVNTLPREFIDGKVVCGKIQARKKNSRNLKNSTQEA
jgi:hypothetical protein